MDDRKARVVANHDALKETASLRKRAHNKEMRKEAHRRYQNSLVADNTPQQQVEVTFYEKKSDVEEEEEWDGSISLP